MGHCLDQDESRVQLRWCFVRISNFFYSVYAYSCGIAMEYGVRPFWWLVVYTVIPFPEHWSCCMEFQKLFSSCCSTRIIWSSHAELCGSESHKLITLHTEYLPLAAESRSTPLTVSLRLTSRASFSSLFSHSCCVESHCSAFLFCLSCLFGESGYMNQCAMWKYCIVNK